MHFRSNTINLSSMRIDAKRRGWAQPAAARGMTMIETMVAMAISSVLILGSITVYNNARSSYRTAESVARIQESLRFVTDTLEQDIRLAGYWGRKGTGAGIARDGSVEITCDGDDVTQWALPENPWRIEGFDDEYDAAIPCRPGSGMQARRNSDVLILRHADPAPKLIPTADNVQAQTNGFRGTFFSADNPPDVADFSNQINDVIVNAYYVSNSSRFRRGFPSLRRRSLEGTNMVDQEIMPGVENLQVQFGIDTDNDDSVDGYVDSDDARVRQNNILSVRLWLLVRSDIDEAGSGFHGHQ